MGRWELTEEGATVVHLRGAEGPNMRVSWIVANFAIGIGPNDGNVVWWTRVDGGGKVVKGVGILVIRLMRRVRKVSRENEKNNVPFFVVLNGQFNSHNPRATVQHVVGSGGFRPSALPSVLRGRA